MREVSLSNGHGLSQNWVATLDMLFMGYVALARYLPLSEPPDLSLASLVCPHLVAIDALPCRFGHPCLADPPAVIGYILRDLCGSPFYLL